MWLVVRAALGKIDLRFDGNAGQASHHKVIPPWPDPGGRATLTAYSGCLLLIDLVGLVRVLQCCSECSSAAAAALP